MPFKHALADLLEDRQHVYGVILDPMQVNVLTQVRGPVRLAEDVEELDALKELVATKGQLHPGFVVALTLPEAARYLEDINSLWGTTHTLDEISISEIDGVTYALIIIAGHRRLYAVRALKSEGSEIAYRADLVFGLSAQEAIEIQFSENQNKRPPPHEEAVAVWKFWEWRRRRREDLTPAQLARRVGRSPEWVRGALRFSALPLSVRRFAYDGIPHSDPRVRTSLKLPYGVLLEIARYHECYQEVLGEALPERVLVGLAERALLDGWSIARTREYVRVQLEVARTEAAGQESLFATETPAPARTRRSAFEPRLTRHLHGQISLVLLVISAQQRGVFDDEPIIDPDYVRSPDAPLALIARCIDLFEAHLDEMVRIAKKRKKNGARLRSSGRRIPAVRRTLNTFDRDDSGGA